MKLQLHELVRDKYYRCLYKETSTELIFKFKSYTSDHIKGHGFIINRNMKTGNNFCTTDNGDNFCTIQFYNMCYLLCDINLEDVIDYLPSHILDKIIYLRKNKIKSLLSL